jgi:hypothetical protein
MNLVRLPKQAFVQDKNCNLDRKYSWFSTVKHCLDIFGFSEVWMSDGVGDVKLFLRAFKNRMIDCYKQDWSAKLSDSDRFATYRSFKSLLQPEKYLQDLTIAKFRKVFVWFRLGVNVLNINNRYNNRSKLCPFCEVIEDENHFLLKCPKYNALREKYIFKYCRSDFEKSLTFLVANEDMFITRSVAMFLYYAFKAREELLKDYRCPC